MMAAEALRHGCTLTVATRTVGKAMNFISALKARVPRRRCQERLRCPISAVSYDLILNGTPAGMYPDINISPVPSAVARKAGAVFDAIYNPIETQLIKLAKRKRCQNRLRTADARLAGRCCAGAVDRRPFHSAEHIDGICSEKWQHFITGRF
jgi:shikimate 5-dehydrogenase